VSSDEVDAVFVLSPTRYHLEHAQAALEAGKHVLVEKPVGRDPQEIRAVAALAAERSLVCMPGHNYAYMPEFRRMVRMVREGRVGEPRLVSVTFALAHAEDVAARYDGVTWLVMPHHVYLTLALLGLPATATGGTTAPMWTHIEQEDQGWIALDYPPHTTALLFATLGADDDASDPWTFAVKVIGTGGSASATWRAAVERDDTGGFSLGWVLYREAYELELAAFLAAVDGDASAVLSTMTDAAAVAEVLAAAEQAIAEKRTISVHSTENQGEPT
jgi:predicted dehydrogenase